MIHTVYIDNPAVLVQDLRVLGAELPSILSDCMRNALILTGCIDDIWTRTPKSSRDRYAGRYKSAWDLIDQRTGNLRKGVRKSQVQGLTPEQQWRVNQYGNENLANSLIPGGNTRSDAPFTVEIMGAHVRVSIGSSVVYAARIHETEKPGEGEMYDWTDPTSPGWSAEGTGNKYIERPLRDLHRRILEEFEYQFDAELEKRGLF